MFKRNEFPQKNTVCHSRWTYHEGSSGEKTQQEVGWGTEDTGSNHQTRLLTREDIPTIVQAVLDALPQRNSGNAIIPTAETPISQGMQSPDTRPVPADASRPKEDGELL